MFELCCVWHGKFALEATDRRHWWQFLIFGAKTWKKYVAFAGHADFNQD
jgi:hypothetical protein